MASVPVISAASSPAEVKLWFEAQLLPANAKVDELEGLTGRDVETLVHGGDLLETLVDDVRLPKAKARALARNLEKAFPGTPATGAVPDSVPDVASGVADRLRTHRLFVVVLDFVPDMLRKYLRRSFRAKHGVAWSPALGRTWFNGGTMPP